MEIALDLMAGADRSDAGWLLSGSRDLERLVEVLRAKAIRIFSSGTEGMAARELGNAVDRFWHLSEFRIHLEKAEAIQEPVFSRSR